MSNPKRSFALSAQKRALLEKMMRQKGVESPAAGRIPRRSDTVPAPLSFAQQRLWFLDQLEPGSPVYHIPAAVRVTGPLQPVVLQQALSAVLERHESLRTRFPAADGLPSQIIEPPIELVLPVTDLRDLPAELRDDEARRLARNEARQPFDLARGPLFRARLLVLGEQEHIVLFTVHHIVFDGWSWNVLLAELAAMYDAYSAGRQAPLPELSIQYADYAVWQHNWFQGEPLNQMLAFWKEELAGPLPTLDLPTDRPRPTVLSLRAALCTRPLPDQLADRLRALAQAENATLFMTLLAGFQVLLARLSNQNDVLVGTPVAGRSRAELEGLIGLFVNTIVMRGRLGGNPTFREYLGRVRATALAAYSHQDLPLERLVDELKLQRDLSREAIFQVMFILENAPPALELRGLQVSQFEVEREAAPFDLTLFVSDSAGRLTATLEYSTDLFDADTATALLERYERLLLATVTDPNQHISELPLLTEAEQRQLHNWNDTTVSLPNAMLHQLVEDICRRVPDAPAVGTVSYRELNNQADSLAQRLSAHGAGPECIVGVCLERSPEAVVAILAVLKTGSAYLPLDPSYPAERLEFMLEDSGAQVLLTRRQYLSNLSLPNVTALVLEDRSDPAETNLSLPAPQPDNLAYVIYTSGSTGRPKGVAITHRGICNRLLWGQVAHPLTRNDRVLLSSSLSFDASVLELFHPLISGASVVVASPDALLDPTALVQLLQTERVTVATFVPSLLQVLLEQSEFGNCTTLRQVICGGEAMPPDLPRQFYHLLPQATLSNFYGPTETSIDVLCWDVERDSVPGGVPIGRPVGNLTAHVLDDHMQPVPIGVVGELYVGGVGLARGYLHQPGLTAERFVPDPWGHNSRLYRTGDLVRRRRDGAIVYVSRADDQIKLRGHRIELDEIAVALTRHPAVREAVALLRNDAGTPRLLAYASTNSQALTADELQRFLAKQLPSSMVPASIILLPDLPHLPSGKVDRRALSARMDPAPAMTTQYAPPRTDAEEQLAAVWAELLGMDQVGIHDNFFALGGDSILGIQMVARAQRVGLRITPKQLFLNQTIAELATVAGRSPLIIAEQGPVIGAVPLSPIQHWFFEQQIPDRHHYNQSLLLHIHQPLNPQRLKQAVARLLEHHDALRLRFRQGSDGWIQENAPLGQLVPVSVIDLSATDDRELPSAIASSAATVQASLDLSNGPVFRVTYLDGGPNRIGRLLLVAHHLVIDAISWRIILEDLLSIYQQLDSPAIPQLPPKTTSFKQWSEHLTAVAATEPVRQELDYWLGVTNVMTYLPIDGHGDNSEGIAQRVEIELTADETDVLLYRTFETYRVRPDEVLLTALAKTLVPWAGGQILVDLEGHGRDSDDERLDLSRTVGWFTSIFPIRLESLPDGAGESLRAVKEQLRSIPRGGIGYGLLRYLADTEIRSQLAMQPQSQVSFNYLGQLDRAVPAGVPFEIASESAGPDTAPSAPRRYLIDLIGSVTGGKLQLAWVFSPGVHDRATIEQLAKNTLSELRVLLDHCRQPDAGGFSPTDFPLVPMDQSELDRLVATDRNIEDIWPLTPMQEGMLFHALADSGSGMYVEQVTCTLRGELDTDAFRCSWQTLLNRHAALRAAFVWEGTERPLQVIRHRVELSWSELDQRTNPKAIEQFEAMIRDDRRRGYAVDQAPLMRVVLVRTGDQEYQLLWSHHHLLMDGWSLPIVLKEVMLIYQAQRRRINLSADPVRPYRDYIAWLGKQNLTEAQHYWTNVLSGFTSPTPLGIDRGAAAATGESSEQRLQLSEETTRALDSFARSHRLTLNVLVRGAWALLLGRYSGQADVLFGATVSGRPAALPGVESMIGMFINTLPVRVSIDESAELITWLRGLQEQQEQLRDYEHSPLAQIQACSELPRGTPLFESILVFENYPIDGVLRRDGGDLDVSDICFIDRTSVPLALMVLPGNRLTLRVTYEQGRFDDQAIGRMLRHIERLLEAIATFSKRVLADLPHLTTAELAQIRQWNTTESTYPSGVCLHHLFEAQVERTPSAVALRCGIASLTYIELNQRANRLVTRLVDLDVRPGDLVGIYLTRTPELVVSILATLKSGAAYMPLDPEYPAERLAFMLEDSQPTAIITEQRLETSLPPTAARIIVVDAEGEREHGEQSVKQPVVSVTPRHLAYVLYTSGSTGRPKGVMVEHGNAVNFVHWATTQFASEELASTLASTSVCFDISVTELFAPLAMGGTIVLVDSALDLIDLPNDPPITLINLVPSVLGELLSAGSLPPTVRTVVVAGEALSGTLAERVLAVPHVQRLLNCYGPTEATVYATWLDVPRELDGEPTIGGPLSNLTAHVLDHCLRPLPVGVAGELYIGGAGIARGYLNRPALTAERFVPDPFGTTGGRLYRTGDRARWRDDGQIEFLGRFDGQVKIRGHRIELSEIEAHLSRHPALRQVAVVAMDDRPGVKRLVAYVSTTEGQTAPSVEELRVFLRERLPDYMVPSNFVLLAALPQTANGKINRKALPALGSPSVATPYQAPRTADEDVVAKIWADVLGLPRVGVHDNFFELGGDSILSIQIVARARRAGLRITPRHVFQHPTVAELTAAIQAAPAAAIAEQGPITGPVPLTPVQHWFFEQQLPEPHYFNQALLLDVDQHLDRDLLQKSIHQLLEHHDALRMRFHQTPNGWEQENAAPGDAIVLDWIDLSSLSSSEQRDRIESHSAELQASLDLTVGPVFRAVYFDLRSGQPGRLLLLAHHLVIDAVSWRLLLEDLLIAYEQLRRGSTVELPPKTTSFKSWAEHLVEYARSNAVQTERQYWFDPQRFESVNLPVDHHGPNTQAFIATVELELDDDETHALLHEVPRAYRTQINEVLLTALVQGLAPWLESDSLLVNIEGHGREDVDGLDVSRTVGWFTTIFPVRLTIPSGGPGEALRSIKEQLRAVPHHGLGYGLLRYLGDAETITQLREQPQAQISFNYLGRIDRALPDGAPLRPATESPGPERSPHGLRAHLLDVAGHVWDGRLHLSWIFSEQVHERTTVEQLASAVMTALRALIAHCQQPGVGGYSPSDFPLARLSQLHINTLFANDRNVEDIYPLSPMQQGMLFHTLFAPEAAIYTEQFDCTLHGEMDAPAFRAAWQRVVDRHPVLRSAFVWKGIDEPLQIVRRHVELPWLEYQAADISVSELRDRDRRLGFDLESAPLLRVSLVRINDTTHHLLCSHHHLLLDGWSLPLLLREVLALYETARAGQALYLEPPRPYRDYIAWLYRQDPAAADQFWRERLSGFSEPTPLGIGRDLSPDIDSTTAEEQVLLSAEVTNALSDFARSHQLTLNTLVQGAWALLLCRYSGRSDVLFGTTVSGRPADLSGVESMIGLFINTLPVRVRLHRSDLLLPWLHQLQQAHVEARQFEYASLSQIQACSDVPRGTPLFQSLVVFENYPWDGSTGNGLTSLTVSNAHAHERSNYPITLVAIPGRELALRVIFDQLRFTSDEIRRLLGHLANLLQAMPASGGQPLAALPMISVQERELVVELWNRTDTDYPRTSTIHSEFERIVTATPQASALSFDGGEWTYKDLNAKADRLAERLRALNVRLDNVVAVCAERSPELIASLLAILKAGGAYMPLDPAYPAERLQFMLSDSAASAVLVQSKLKPLFDDFAGPVLVLDEPNDAAETSIIPRPHVTADHLAYVIYTSGSTGTPKGVAVRHRGVLRMTREANHMRLAADETFVLLAPVTFDASTIEIWSPLLNGSRLVIAPPGNLSLITLGELIRHYQVTTLWLTAGLFHLMVQEHPEILGNVRQLLSGGDVVSASHVERILPYLNGGRFVNGYGPTETTVFGTSYEVTSAPVPAPLPIGFPFPCTQTYVLDAWGDPVPVGVPGELFIGGDGVARGYVNRPGLTAERFVPDPFGSEPGGRLYRTGDLVRWREDGSLEFLGRLDDQVKIRGFRVEPGEVEVELSRQPVVAQTAVVARRDPAGGHRLVAYVVPREGMHPSSAELLAFLRARLPEHMIPSDVVILSAMPLTAHGKIDRRALPDPQRGATSTYIAPRSPIEERLAAQFAQVLGTPRVGIEDSFFDLGGHSLLATQLASRIYDEFKVELPLRTIFERPTVAGVAEELKRALAAGTNDSPALEPIPRGRPLPVSFSQQRLWFLDRLEPGTSLYNVPLAARLRGLVDIEALGRSLTRLAHRHEVLRTAFAEQDGMPVALVRPMVEITPQVEELSSSTSELDAEIRRRIDEEARRSFNLAEELPWRVVLLQLANDDYVVVLTFHHIAFDGWSAAIFFHELAALYSEATGGPPAELLELPIQYADWAAWQRRWLSGTTFQRQLEYWRDQLAGVPPLDLPTDRPRPAVRTAPGATLSHSLPAELSAKLTSVARSHGGTLYMALLAGLEALLHRYTGQVDFAVGTPVAGRTRREAERLIGFFVNTLALRADVSGDPSFGELLGRVRESSLGALANQEMPFERLVEELKPARDPGRTPLFQVMFSMLNTPAPAREFGGLEAELLDVGTGRARFDLTFSVAESMDERLEVNVDYDTDLFEPATIRRMLSHYEQLLIAAAGEPSRHISELALLSDGELQQFSEWNRTTTRYAHTGSIHEMFEAQASRTPDMPAVAFEGRILSYREMDKRSALLARYLISLGVGPETLVGLCIERSAEMVVGLLGVLRSGGAYVPLDPLAPADRIAYIAEDARLDVILTRSGLRHLVPERHRIVLLDEPLPDVDVALPQRVAPEHPAYVIYTSGSTGRPKGVVVEHRHIVNYVQAVQDRLGLAVGASYAMVQPLAVDSSQTVLFPPLVTGGCLHMVSEERALDPELLADYFESHQIDILKIAPSHLTALQAGSRPASLMPRRWLVIGGEASQWEWVRRTQALAPDCVIHNHYGPTEATVGMLTNRVTRNAVTYGAVVPMGRPLPNTRAYLLDRHFCPVPQGVPGELFIGGDCVARGYLNRPALTAERFVPDPFGAPGERMYRTGDLARMLPDQTLEFLGRFDHQVKVRGYRVELGEVEAAILSHDSIRETIVSAREDVPGQKRLVAYIVPANDPLPSPEMLRRFLLERLPEYMVPSAFVALDALPRTRHGKIDRLALPAPSTDSVTESAGYVAPRTPTEELLAGLFAQVLGTDRVGVEDNFFDLGGHSLLATQLASRMRDAFRVELPLRRLFEVPTIAGLAAAIDEARSAGGVEAGPPIVPTSRDTAQPLSFAQQRLWFLDRLQPGLSTYNIPIALRLHGPLDIAALNRAFAALIDRQEVLRTVYVEQAGIPVAVARPNEPAIWPVEDLTEFHPTDIEAEIQRRVAIEGQTPFDLSKGVWRARLLRLSDHDHVVMLTIHHIATDGWSNLILFRELTELYAAEVEGRSANLPPLPVQYADYAAWQRERAENSSILGQIDYWREALQELPPALELPADHPRPVQPTFRGASVVRRLAPETTAGLRVLARREGVTPFMALMAVLQTLLYRFTGQADFAIGTPVAGRTRAEVEGLIGFFVNTLVIPAHLGDTPTFRDLLRRVRESCLGAFANQEIPFERLVEVLQPQRNLSRSPFFQVMLAMAPGLPQSTSFGGLTAEPLPTETGQARFDLTFAAAEWDGTLHLSAEYSTELFDASTIERLLAHFEYLLAAAVMDASWPIADMPIMPALDEVMLIERGQVSWASADGPCLHERFAQQVERRPDAPALTCEGQTLTYRELDRAANRLANLLQRRGVSAGSLVGICLERSEQVVVSILATLKAGAAYVPLDPAYPADRLRFMLRDAGVSALIRTSSLQSRFDLNDVPVILLDTDADAISNESDETPLAVVAPGDPAYVIYTSGSTGQPKGVVVSHANVMRLFTATQEWFQFDEEDVWTLFHSYAFDFSVWEIWGALLYGGRLVVVPFWISRSPQAFLELLAIEGVTVLNQTPSAFRQLVQADELAGHPNLALRLVIFGGEALDLQSLRPWFAHRGDECPRLVNMYGITETTVHVTYRPVSMADVEANAGSVIGQQIPDLELYVLDKQLRPVPIGGVGELYVGGAGLARGYLNRPALTAERFIPNPFSRQPGARLYRSGDLARLLPGQDLAYLGRADLQVKVRGFRIELGEIESALLQESVREAVVLLRTVTADDQRLVAYIVPEPGSSIDANDLRSVLATKLPEYMVPAAFVILERLPLTANGKLDRGTLPEPTWAGTSLQEYIAPRTDRERELAALWAETLGVERVGIHDNFFALGGHSLLAVRLAWLVQQRLGRELPLRQLFLQPTVAGLAALMEQAEQQTRTAIKIADRTEPLALSFAQQRLWFLEQLEPGRAWYHIPLAVRLRGPIDVERIRIALQHVVDRHEILRTSYPARDGVPHQQIAPTLSVAMPVMDLSGQDDDAERHELEALVRQPFDLTHGPLWRAALLRRGDMEHVLALCVHHIAFDGGSIQVLLDEVSAIYAGAGDALPPLTVQYADFAAWQREQLSGDAERELLDYWRRQLEGAPASLDLPTDRPRTTEPSYRDDVVEWSMPGETSAALRALAAQENSTPFMAVLAGFAALLGRWAGQDWVNVGVPISGRSRPELEELIGFFAGTVVVGVPQPVTSSFRDLLQRVRERVSDALSQQEMPLERLVELLQPQRDLSRNPLFQVMLAWQEDLRGPLQLPGGLSLEPVAADTGAAKFEITLSAGEQNGIIQGAWQYQTDLFNRDTIQRLANGLTMLLEAAIAEPDKTLGQLPICSAAERERLLAWGDGSVYPVDPVPAQRLFERQASQAPHATALRYHGTPILYGELNLRANRLAQSLVEHGIGLGDAIGVCMERTPAWVATVLAVLKSGATYVPLDPAYPIQRLSTIARRAGIRLLITDGEPGTSLDVDAPRCTLEDLRSNTEPVGDVDGGAAPNHIAYIIFTSGSTGEPKGVPITHRGWVNLALAQRDGFGVTAGERVLQFAPAGFDASVSELMLALAWGQCLVLARREELLPGADLVRLLQDERITMATFPPSLLALLPEAEFPDLRTVIVAGERCTPDIVQRFGQGRRLINAYGPTECSVCVSLTTCTDADRASVIGGPISNTRCYVLDQHLQPVPVGVSGELWIGGTGLSRGYWQQPALTAERFLPDPFAGGGERMYRTGDRVRWLGHGQIEFIGRADAQVKVRGVRVEPGEVEATLRSQPGVRDAVVIGSEPGPSSSHLIAYIVRDSETDWNLAAIQESLARRLPAPFIPSRWVMLDELPRLPNGKIDRRRLPDAAPTEVSALVPAVPPRNRLEEIVVEAWKAVLGAPSIGIHDNFFALGGDSLLGLRLLARLERAGWRLQARDLYRAQTPAEQAALLRQAATSEERPAGPVALTPIQRWFFEREFASPHHWNQALLLNVSTMLPAELIRTAFSKVVEHHDALRLRFERGPGGWHAYHADEAGVPFEFVDLSEYSAETQRGEIERIAANTQASLDLAHGPLARAVYFRLGTRREARLLVVAHHLVIDTASWAILFEDMALLAESILAGQEGVLPGRTTSFQRWSDRLQQFASDEEIASELNWWLAQTSEWAPLPVDLGGENREAGFADETRELDEQQTRRLLGNVDSDSHTPEEQVLAALVFGLTEWCGRRQFVVQMESHGRDVPFDDVNLSRTVGWFTAAYPMRIDVAEDLPSTLTEIAQQLRRVPQKGIGYGLLRYLKSDTATEPLRFRPEPEISFNYLGRQGQADVSLVRLAPESPGPVHSPAANRAYLLEFSAVITEGRLRLRVGYCRDVHTAQTASLIADRWLASLLTMLPTDDATGDGGPLPAELVELNPGTSGTPWFWLHPVEGSVQAYAALAHELHDVRMLAIQPPEFVGGVSAATLEDMAAQQLAIIRRVQPHGPYHLGGWSMGGLLAYEIARQLSASGEEIAILTLIDQSAQPSEDARILLDSILSTAEIPATRWNSLELDEQSALLVEAMTRSGQLPVELPPELAQSRARLFLHNANAAGQYQPSASPQRLVLLAAREGVGRHIEQVAAGWQALTGTAPAVYTVGGSHRTVLRPPYLAEVTTILRDIWSRVHST